MGQLLADSENQKVRGLQVVRVPRERLLDTVKRNRMKHREAFKEAEREYHSAVIAELERKLDEARSGESFDSGHDLQAPVDHTGDYDRVIDVLEWTLDAELELPLAEFNKYVRDQWDWSYSFNSSIETYSRVKEHRR